jgi:GTPase SAR1 family protein
MILGNKCDMTEKRVVSKERGEQLALEYGIRFMETSAKNSNNIEEAFYILSKDIKAHIDKKMDAKGDGGGRHVLKQEPQKQKPSWFSKCTIL